MPIQKASWFEQVDLFRAFLAALIEAEYFNDVDDAKDFCYNPENYTELYQQWVGFGSPNEGEDGWTEYFASLEEDEDADEESEDTDETPTE